MKNVLLIALSMLMKKHKKLYMIEQNMPSLTAASKKIAEQCHISYNTLRAIESSSYIPSRDISTRLLQAHIYPFVYSRWVSLIAVIELIGKDMDVSFSFDRVLKAVDNDPELYSLVKKFSDSFLNANDRLLVDNLIPYFLYENNLIKEIEDYLSPVHRTKYYAKFISNESEIPRLVNIWQTLTPEVAPSVEAFRQGWLRNKDSKTVVYRDNTCQEVMGFFSLIPLTASGLQGILNGSIQSGSDMDLEQHVGTSFKDCASIFVGMIACKNRYCASYVISEMFDQLIPLLNESTADNLTARGRTLQGKAIMQRFSFEPIPGNEMSICYLTDDWMDRHRITRVLSYR